MFTPCKVYPVISGLHVLAHAVLSAEEDLLIWQTLNLSFKTYRKDSVFLWLFASPFGNGDDCPSPAWYFYHCQGACQGTQGWRMEGQFWEENICPNPFRILKFQPWHFNQRQKQISPKSTVNGLNPAGKRREWSDYIWWYCPCNLGPGLTKQN